MLYNSRRSVSVDLISICSAGFEMREEILALLTSYLGERIGIDSVRDWIAHNVWDSPAETRDLIDQIAVELAHIDDGNSDEEYFRTRMAELARNRFLGVWFYWAVTSDEHGMLKHYKDGREINENALA